MLILTPNLSSMHQTMYSKLDKLKCLRHCGTCKTFLKCGTLTAITDRTNNKPVTLQALVHTRAADCTGLYQSGHRLLPQNSSISLTGKYIQSIPASLLFRNTCAINLTRFYSFSSSHGRRFKTKNIFKKQTERNYYDILGITPKATQAQVKTAYYKLSKLHHPDIHHSTEDGAQVAENQAKFSEISEAYRVLGNTLLRRRYDRGILSPRDTAESVKKQEQADIRDNKVYRPATEKKIYDFDEFYTKHYGESISRERQARVERMQQEARYHKEMNEKNSNLIVPLTLVILFGIIYNIHKYISESNDLFKSNSFQGKR